ncbi:GNAT family N-acetyltransferase [Paenibacillus sp. sptzw28]|uniref:GNAT family N-acetyltransferase n=1 Tax=Paenibacillus sp. sptzw28 TaxID=715179 RepID=UPI001C6DFF92|nr:GNAT family N-acetyltransferase [Paenibacillus sp. sptzw28]QYR19330.1 GNAT family N-acetyltransferase [Paenibacillus sp. sptzw28]
MNSSNQAGSADNIFTIDCKDVLLREYQISDIDAIYSITHQPEIVEYLPGWNVSREQRLDWLLNYETVENKQFLEAVSKDGGIENLRLRLGIISKETGEFIGWCCTGIKDELPPSNREIMFAISKDYTNKGYTTQAVQGIIKYLFEHTDIEQLNSIALLRNLPSNRVIRKCGFDFQTIIEIRQEQYNHYTISKSKWRY